MPTEEQEKNKSSNIHLCLIFYCDTRVVFVTFVRCICFMFCNSPSMRAKRLSTSLLHRLNKIRIKKKIFNENEKRQSQTKKRQINTNSKKIELTHFLLRACSSRNSIRAFKLPISAAVRADSTKKEKKNSTEQQIESCSLLLLCKCSAGVCVSYDLKSVPPLPSIVG